MMVVRHDLRGLEFTLHHMTLVTLQSNLCITKMHSKLTLYRAFIIRFAEVHQSTDHVSVLFSEAGIHDS